MTLYTTLNNSLTSVSDSLNIDLSNCDDDHKNMSLSEIIQALAEKQFPDGYYLWHNGSFASGQTLVGYAVRNSGIVSWYTNYTARACTVSINNDTSLIAVSNGSSASVMGSAYFNAINFANYSSMKVTFGAISQTTSSGLHFVITTGRSDPQSYVWVKQITSSMANQTVTIDLSSATTSGYLGIHSYNYATNYTSVQIYDIVLQA